MNQDLSYGNAGKKQRIVFLVSACILVILFVYRVLLIFSYNGELAGIDNNFVFDVSRSIAGTGPYTQPALPPFAITLYAPLYFTVCSAIGKMAHINPDQAISVYQLCRFVSLLADLVTCILLYFILRKRFNTSKHLSWLAVAGFACILCKLGYTFSRSDSFLLAFYAGSLYVLTSPNKNIRNLLLLALFSAGCIFSKQNGIIVPFAIVSWLLVSSERKKMLYYSIAFLGVTGILLVVYKTSYPYLYMNTITALRNRIDPAWFYSDIFKRSMDSLWILPLYFAVVVAVRQWQNPAKRMDRAIAAVLILQVLFDLAISLKWGSSVSYFNESLLLAFVILFRNASESKTHIAVSTDKIMVVLPLMLLFFFHTIAEGYLFFLQHRSDKKAIYEQQEEIRSYLQPKLNSNYVLDLTDPNSDFFKTLFYKEIAVPNMDMADCCTIPDGNFDYSLLKQDLTNGKIKYVITHENDRLSLLWGIPLGHYVKDTTMNGYTLYAFDPAGAGGMH